MWVTTPLPVPRAVRLGDSRLEAACSGRAQPPEALGTAPPCSVTQDPRALPAQKPKKKHVHFPQVPFTFL